MEILDADTEFAGISADLIQRNEAVIAVEGGVFDSLRHDGSRHLLEFHGEAGDSAFVPARFTAVNVEQQDAANEIKDAQIGRSASFSSRSDCLLYILAVLGGDFAVGNVGAIHGKACNDFAQRAPQAVEREVTGTAVGQGEDRKSTRLNSSH